MSKRILVIENDPISMELMLFLLKSFGFEVMIAFDGAAGLELAGISHPDLILCDVEMPGLSGISVVRELKKRTALADVRIIAVTAMSMAGDEERLLRSGFHGYIGKPVDPMTLQSQLLAFIAAGAAPAPL